LGNDDNDDDDDDDDDDPWSRIDGYGEVLRRCSRALDSEEAARALER
jgi:hypothetical protein